MRGASRRSAPAAGRARPAASRCRGAELVGRARPGRPRTGRGRSPDPGSASSVHEVVQARRRPEAAASTLIRCHVDRFPPCAVVAFSSDTSAWTHLGSRHRRVGQRGRARRTSRSADRSRARARPRRPAASTSCARRPSAAPRSAARSTIRSRSPSLLGDVRRLLHHLAASSRVGGSATDLGERRPGEGADRIESQIAPRLDPEMRTDVGQHPRREAGGGEARRRSRSTRSVRSTRRARRPGTGRPRSVGSRRASRRSAAG